MPSAETVLACLKGGVTVRQIILDTRASRAAVERLAVENGYYIDRSTDKAAVMPNLDQELQGGEIRRWGRANGWPTVGKTGTYPKAMLEAYEAAHRD